MPPVRARTAGPGGLEASGLASTRGAGRSWRSRQQRTAPSDCTRVVAVAGAAREAAPCFALSLFDRLGIALGLRPCSVLGGAKQALE